MIRTWVLMRNDDRTPSCDPVTHERTGEIADYITCAGVPIPWPADVPLLIDTTTETITEAEARAYAEAGGLVCKEQADALGLPWPPAEVPHE